MVLLLLLVLMGCGQIDSEEQTVGIGLEIHLPGSLSRTEERRARFEGRVIRLELAVRSRSGVHESFVFAPGDWDHISIPGLKFPSAIDDKLLISGRIWDMGKDGTQRAYPALSGNVSLRASEMAANGPTIVPLRLTLKVPVSEYD